MWRIPIDIHKGNQPEPSTAQRCGSVDLIGMDFALIFVIIQSIN